MFLNKLFVYGTLLPGLDNYNRFVEKYKPRVYPARTRGTMFYLPADGYPVVLDEGDGEIKGVVFESRDMSVIVPEIDEIEKFTGIESQSYLIREAKEVELLDTGETIRAHMYLWPPSRSQWLKDNALVIPDGDWARYLKEKEQS